MELNIQGYKPYAGQHKIVAPPNRIVVARPPLEDDGVRSIVTTTGEFRPDLGTVLAVGEAVPYRQHRNCNWVPSERGTLDYELPKVGDTVVVRHNEGIGIVSADLGVPDPPDEVRVYGQGIPSGSVTYLDVQLVPLFRGVLAVMKNEQFVKVLGDQILVVADPEPERDGSILLPDSLRRPSGMGTVLMSGPLAIKSGVRPGYRVCWDITCSKVAKIVGKERTYLMRPASVLYVVTE